MLLFCLRVVIVFIVFVIVFIVFYCFLLFCRKGFIVLLFLLLFFIVFYCFCIEHKHETESISTYTEVQCWRQKAESDAAHRHNTQTTRAISRKQKTSTTRNNKEKTNSIKSRLPESCPLASTIVNKNAKEIYRNNRGKGSHHQSPGYLGNQGLGPHPPTPTW